MEKLIKELQQHFIKKILKNKFTPIYNSTNKEIQVVIDGYRFNFYLSGGIAIQMPTWNIQENFMDLQISQDESKEIGAILLKIVETNITDEQKEKDLAEYERIKQLYNLI